jgi:hypothetical protein
VVVLLLVLLLVLLVVLLLVLALALVLLALLLAALAVSLRWHGLMEPTVVAAQVSLEKLVLVTVGGLPAPHLPSDFPSRTHFMCMARVKDFLFCVELQALSAFLKAAFSAVLDRVTHFLRDSLAAQIAPRRAFLASLPEPTTRKRGDGTEF